MAERSQGRVAEINEEQTLLGGWSVERRVWVYWREAINRDTVWIQDLEMRTQKSLESSLW